MNRSATFSDVVDSTEQLSVEEQEALLMLLSRRLAETGRKRIVADVADAREEYRRGSCRPMSVEAIISEIQP